MKARFATLLGTLFSLLCLLALTGFDNSPRPGQLLDEARVAGRDAASFPPADEDYFHDMDGAIALSPEEIKGRNMWLVWSGGDDRFWDGMTTSTFGGFDLLKIVAYDPTKKIDRDRRWTYLGLINEPCFDPPKVPDKDRFGLLLDTRRSDCPPDPFADASKYPGVKIGARGDSVPVGSYYGYPSGIVGLRLFPTRSSTRRRQSAGTPPNISPIRATTTTGIWSGPTASACHADSAMSDPRQPIRQPIRRIRNGRT